MIIKMKKKLCSSPQYATSRTSLMLGLLFILLIGTVSAFEWDNKLTYSNEDLKVDFTNSILLLFPTSEIGSIELKSHNSVDEIKEINIGKDKVVMYYDFNFLEIYENGLGDVTFIDMRTGETIDKDYSFVYWGDKVRDVYGYDCNLFGNGTCGINIIGTETYKDWLPYDSRDIPKEDIRIGIKVDVEVKDYIDGIWEIIGKKVEKHITWVAGATEDAETATGDEGNDQDYTTTMGAEVRGIITGVLVGGRSASAFVANITITQGGVQVATKLTGSLNQDANVLIGFDLTEYKDQTPLEIGAFEVRIFRTSGSGVMAHKTSRSFDGSLFNYSSQTTTWRSFAGADDVTYNFTQYSIGDDPPSVILNSPVDTFNTTNSLVTFNATVVDAFGLKNVTLFLDGILNETNSSGINNSDYIFTGTFADGNHNWSILAFDNANQTNQSDTRTFSVNTTPIINVTSPLNTSFTTSTIFFNATNSVSVDTWIANYNGTNTTLSNINTSLTVEDGFHQLLLYGNNSVSGVFGINNTVFFTVNTTPIINVTSPLNTSFTTSTIFFNATNTLAVDTWIVNYNGTNTTLLGINTSLTVEDGFHQLLLYGNNSISGVFGLNDTVFFTVDTTPIINVTSPLNTSFTTSTIFFNATNTLPIDKWIANYNGTNTTLSDINTSLEVEDGSHQLLLYGNNSVTGVFGLNNTVFFSVNTTPIINVTSPLNINFTTSTIFFNATNTLTIDTWIVNYNGTNTTLSDINTSLEVEDGSHQLLLYGNNSVTGVFGLNNTVLFSVDATLPLIEVTSPTGVQGTFTSGTNLTLTWNFTEANPDVCQYEYNGENTTVTCSINTTNLTVTDSTNTSLTFWINDTFGNIAFNTTTWIYSFIENNITFNENVSETSSQFFEINLSTSLSVLSITAQLNYNGTNYPSTATCNGTCIVNNTIDIPLVPTGESQVKSFFWAINIFNGTDSISVNTSSQNQNVSRIHIETCDATFTSKSLNFSTYDEQNLSRISPYRFDGTFDIWLGGATVKRNNNFTNSSTTEEVFCILPNATYFVDAQIDYNEPTNTTYTTRNYYLQNDTISNVSQDIFMYLLPTTSATSFILLVQDDNLLPLEDYLVVSEKYYPGEDIFRAVQIARTAENGKSVGFFEVETVDYRFIIKRNGTTFLTTLQQKIIGEVVPFTLTFTIGEELGKPWASLENKTNLDFSLAFDKTSNLVTYTYIDTSGNFTLGSLIVEKQNFTFATNTVLCSLDSSQSSATMICNMSGNTTGTFVAKGFITRGSTESLISQVNFIIQELIDILGGLGLILAWFIILISAFAFKFNEVAGIFMVNAAVIFVNLIGLVSFGMLAISALVAVSIIIVVVMQK